MQNGAAMWITIGIFLLILGFALLLAGVARGLFARAAAPTSWKYALSIGATGAVLILASFFMLHHGEGQGVERVPIGIAVVIAGLVLMVVGVWLAMWAPIAFRNTMNGWKLILVGLAVLVLGIVIMTVREDLRPRHGGSPHFSHINAPDWSCMFSHRIGPIPFGAFALAVWLVANGFGIRNGLSRRALLGANVVIVGALILLYALGPQLFSTW